MAHDDNTNPILIDASTVVAAVDGTARGTLVPQQFESLTEAQLLPLRIDVPAAMIEVLGETGGEVAVAEPFQVGGLDDGLSDEERRNQNDIFARFTTGERPVEQWLPEEQAEIARTLLDSLDDPIEERAKLSNAILLSGLFGMDVDTIILMQPEMIKQIYGKELQSLSD